MEARYGMCGLRSHSATITLPRANNPVFTLIPYRIRAMTSASAYALDKKLFVLLAVLAPHEEEDDIVLE